MNDILKPYRGWLYARAITLLYPTHEDLDDLVQEGWIAMWQALSVYDPERGALPSWLTTHAKYRMLDVVKDWSWTGKLPVRDGRNPVRRPELLSLDDERVSGDTVPDPEAEDLMDSVELAYHYGEIGRALDELTPRQRQYVVARFWAGMTGREMAEELFGYDAQGLWSSAKNGARLKLVRKLEHLR